MTFTLLDASRLSFSPSERADAACEKLRITLGFSQRYPTARLAIARSLALPDVPPEAADTTARAIRAQQLFGSGADLATWVALIGQSRGAVGMTSDDFRHVVAGHWERGAQLLWSDWEQAGGDAAAFVRHLVEIAGLDPMEATTIDPSSGDSEAPQILVPSPVVLPIGPVSTVLSTQEKIEWPMNAAGSSPHAAVMGGIGSGKTRTATGMLHELRRQMSVPLIAFDFKGDMTDSDNALDQVFGAGVLAPPHNSIPLDVLALDSKGGDTSVALAAQRLRDTMSALKGTGFGAVQKGLFIEAAETALRRQSPTTLANVRDALKALYEETNRKPDGASTTMDDLCRFPLFEPKMAPSEFFQRSWIIRLTSDLPDVVRTTTVTLVLDSLDRYLNSLPDAPTDGSGARALRVLCVIDEAHRILGVRLKGLDGLIRLGRSKGGAVMLISQSPDDFDGEDDDLLAEMGLVLALATNANPRAVKRLLPSANLSALEKGQAWAKLRGRSKAELIQAWSGGAS